MDYNFDQLWQGFKGTLERARGERDEMFDGNEVKLHMHPKSNFSIGDGEPGEEGAGLSLTWRGVHTFAIATRDELREIAAHCLLTAENMKPEPGYLPLGTETDENPAHPGHE